MKNRKFLGAVALVFIGIVFGAVLISGFGFIRPSYADIKIGSENPPVESINPDAAAFNNAFVQVAEKVTPSIVQIKVVTETKNDIQEKFKFFWPFGDESHPDVPDEQLGGGSGIIISADGYILTNNHVVENAKSVEVGLFDKRQLDATVIGRDPLTDLAVIKISAGDLPVAYLGDSDQLKVGQWVMAIGNPLSLSSTVTAGIISAMGRNLGLIRDSYSVENFIQTDAAINPGNSGGALVDLNGAVIGINSAIATDGMSSRYIGYGFAIPINLAKSVATDLIANGSVSRGYIGVNITAVDNATAKALGLSKAKGVLIQNIVEGGAASGKDIKPGDVILKIDGREVNEPNELQSYVAQQRAGKEIELTLFRDGKELTRSVTLKARDKDKDVEFAGTEKKETTEKDLDLKEINLNELGLSVKNLTKDEASSFKVDNGIIITKVKRFGKAYDQRLQEGSVITEVDRKPVNSVSQFEDLINSKKGKAVLLKVVLENGNTFFIGLDIPE